MNARPGELTDRSSRVLARDHHRFAFVLEQTLGHRAHSQNLERAIQAEPGVEATVIKLEYRRQGVLERVPGLGNWSLRASRQTRAALRRQVAAGPLDGVFIHTQVAALLAAGLMRATPTVVSLDATPVIFDGEGAAYGHRRGPLEIEAIKHWFNRRAFAAASALVTWSRMSADSLCKDYSVSPDKVRIVRPGVDLSLFRPGATRVEDGGPVRILFVGGDFQRKGGLDLLAAMSRLWGRARLHIVSASEIQLPPGAPAHVHRGLRPQSPELVDLFRTADLFVLPSRGDCLPQVLAEALACGLPVVATSVGAIPEVIRHGENGYLVPPASPAPLADALEALVMKPELRRAMGRNGLEIARREHDAMVNNRAILRLMSELARTAREGKGS